VRIFAREDDELARFSDRSYRVFEASVAAARTRAVYIPLIAFIPNLAVAFLLYYGGRQVVDGGLSLGALVAFYSYLMMLVSPARVIGWLTGLAQRAIASGERVYEILDAPLEMHEKPDARPLRGVGPAKGTTSAPETGADLSSSPLGAVDFDGVWFSYGERPVLRGVTLSVPAGRTVALVGHTGCGKTTLTNLVPRFYDPGGGSVRVDGQDVRDLQLADLRRHIGVVTQDPFLFSTSIAENIRFGKPDASEEEVRAAARTAQADDFIEALPDAIRPSSGSAASPSAAASASASPSHGRSSWTRASSSSTTPRAVWTRRQSPASGRPSGRSCAGAPPSSSPTVRARSPWPSR